ncbi:MAG: divergent PAP2 family protein [Treponema sp.]|nr:divergent PAP2 family protein [Treponema sp.]
MFADISLRAASIRAFFENPVFMAPFTSLLIAQLLKGLIHVLSGRMKRTRELVEIITWRTGGMPSSHASVVCALCVSIAFVEGLKSNMFVLSMWFAMVVLRDAVGVRRATGLLSKTVNSLGRTIAEKTGAEFHPAKEIKGHTPLEVVVGGLLGVFVAAGIALL